MKKFCACCWNRCIYWTHRLFHTRPLLVVSGNPYVNRDTKRSICQMLIEHVKGDSSTAALLVATLTKTMENGSSCTWLPIFRCNVLLEA
jgi:hypothetical protein